MRRSILEKLTPDQRNYPAKNGIDPGLLNYRRLLGFLPKRVTQRIVDAAKRDEPAAKLGTVAFDHFLTEEALAECARIQAPTLAALLSRDEVKVGDVVCSYDKVRGRRSVYTAERVGLAIILSTRLRRTAQLELATESIRASTTRLELSETSHHAYIAQVIRVVSDDVILSPLVLGGPLAERVDDAPITFDPYMYSGYFWETFPEDVDEFASMRSFERAAASDSWHALRDIPERIVKDGICSLLGESSRKDWGGEQSDHFSTSLHLSGRRITAAFLLKGPSNWRPMTARHLGKNGDQIYRLANEPAELLMVQHSHLITEPVRATLRQFALQPYRSRRWCVLDGPDTYRLFKSAGLLPGRPQRRRVGARGEA